MKRYNLFLILSFLSLNTFAQNSGQYVKSNLPEGKQWELVWHDEFDGNALDTTKWGFRLHIMQKRHQTFTTEGVEVKNGLLYLNLIEKEGQYYSPHLQTGENYMDRPYVVHPSGMSWPIAELKPHKFVHKYGYYEIRCKFQEQPGWWSAFWLQSPTIGSSLDPSISGVEIDIMENMNRDNKIRQNVIWGGYGKNHKSNSSGDFSVDELLEDSPDGFHTFGLYWSKSGYIFYVDGKESRRVDGPVSNVEQFILVSTECRGYRRGNRDQPSDELKEAILPDAFIVDYVRVFDEVTDK
ncbi:MAG: glycoside hydrolase family 16 protein [Fermentimonas sp.]